MATAPVDLNLVFQRVLANLGVTVGETGAEVTSGKLPAVVGDEGALVQLFQNLIDNGIKFRGKDRPKVRVSATDPFAPFTAIAVTDNGIGIDPRHAERVFRVFQRLHTAEEYPGTGIGLAVCKQVVERHGGRIWVDSQPGRGSTFWFTLPTFEVDERKRPPRIEPKSNQEAR
jgi:light-regulated signal transduction histidine kinase (bacteriophytochrome)